MLITLSPSKGQDFTRVASTQTYTQAEQLDDTQILIDVLQQYDVSMIRKLMSVSESLAVLNFERFHNFNQPFNLGNAKQALFAFQGDVYSRIPVDKYSDEDLEYAQDHLRMLSGLYGCLRPLDLIQPYRLEMKTKLTNPRGQNLYQFWGERITEKLNEALEQQQEPVLVNLASNEYFKSVKPKKLNGRVLTVNFKEVKEGKARMIAIFAKRARGLMTDYILRQRVEQLEDLKGFNYDGYEFSAENSDEKQFTFLRPQP